MLAAQMFYGDTLTFKTIVERLRQLETEINSIGRSRSDLQGQEGKK